MTDLERAAKALEKKGAAFWEMLPELAVGFVVALVFWFVSRAIAKAVYLAFQKADQPEHVALLVSRLVRWGLLVLGGLIVITLIVPSLNAASVFGALGVGSIAIGFAFKDILQNWLAGLLILITRPFEMGDHIVTGIHEGVVEHIEVRATRVRLADHRVAVIPNSELYASRVTVYHPNDPRRVALTLTLPYGTDLALARASITEGLLALPQLVAAAPSPEVVVTELAETGVRLSLRFWLDPSVNADVARASDEVLSRIKAVVESQRAAAQPSPAR